MLAKLATKSQINYLMNSLPIPWRVIVQREALHAWNWSRYFPPYDSCRGSGTLAKL